MPLRLLAKMLAQNGEIINQLANTPFIRRLAQLTYYGYRRATDMSQMAIDKAMENDNLKKAAQEKPAVGKITSFTRTFIRNLQEEFEKANRMK